MPSEDLIELVPLKQNTKEPTKTRLPKNIGQIQFLRGLAALFVAMAHLHAVELKLGGEILFGNWALGGFGGVDLFFVISGFVMVRSNFNSTPTPQYVSKFWALRAIRIYPLWWLVMGAIFVVYTIHPDWVYQSHKETPDILKSFLLIPQATLPLHAVGWTLIHELWFYIVFGFILFAPKKLMPAFLVGWALLVAFASLANQNPTPFLAIAIHPLTLEFIMGAGVAIIIKNHKERPYGDVAAILGAVLLFFSFARVAGFAQDFFALKWDRVFYFGLPSAILLYGMVVLELDGFKAKKPLIKLGDWSYALYLIHVPIFAATGRIFARFSREGLLDNFLFCAIAFVAAIIASAILHIMFEKPILKLAHKLLKK